MLDRKSLNFKKLNLKNQFSSNMIKTSLFSFASTFIKVITNLILTKFISSKFGSIGLLKLGNYQNFFQIISNVSSGGINNGIVKYSSEFLYRKVALLKMLKSTMIVVLSFTLLTIITLYVYSGEISKIVFHDSSKSYIIRVTAASLIFFSANIIYTSYLNGIGKIKRFTKVNIFQSLLALFLTIVLVKYLNFDGVLLSIPLAQVIIFISISYLLSKEKKFFKIIRSIKYQALYTKKLFSYSLMTLTAALVAPATILVARNFIEEKYGLKIAGIWQAAQYISTTHLFLLTTSLSVHFLPTFSRLENSELLRLELFKGLKFIWVIISVTSIIIFTFKDLLISLLFSSEFSSLIEFIHLQLISDFFKITSWLFAFLLISKNKVVHFIVFEITTSLVYLLALYFLPSYFDTKGIYISSIVQYSFYLCVLLISSRKLIYMK